MAEFPHKPIRFPGRPKGKPNKAARITLPVLNSDPVEYRIEAIREAGKQCVELLRCVAGACATLFKSCEDKK